METDRDMLSPEEEEAIVPNSPINSPIPGANQTRTKQIVAAGGLVVILVVQAVLTGEFDTEEIVTAVGGLLTVLGVGEVPNRPA